MRTAIVFFLLCGAAFAQGNRPEASAFDMSQLHMEAPPSQGVAVRGGRLCDPKSGANLKDQVILIKGDRITDVRTPWDRSAYTIGHGVRAFQSDTREVGHDSCPKLFGWPLL